MTNRLDKTMAKPRMVTYRPPPQSGAARERRAFIPMKDGQVAIIFWYGSYPAKMPLEKTVTKEVADRYGHLLQACGWSKVDHL